MEGVAHHTPGENRNEAVFNCSKLFEAQSWNHLVVCVQKPGVKGKAKATVYINGLPIGTQRVGKW